MHYFSVTEARTMRGLRLVLSGGVPGPWGEAAKAMLRARNVPFAPVAQEPMAANEELREWTGCRNAPTAVYDDEPPRTGWFDILMLSERLGSGASLLPEASADRALCLGLIMEICGQDGFGWNRRMNMLAAMWGSQAPSAAKPHELEYTRQYGLSPEAAARAPIRTAGYSAGAGGAAPCPKGPRIGLSCRRSAQCSRLVLGVLLAIDRAAAEGRQSDP